MIILNEINKIYPTPTGEVTALRNINLRVKPGEIFGIIGRSGAGKSSLIRCVNLLEKPTKGQVFVDGQELTALSPADLRIARRKIGMIFQHFNLLTSRTVYDNIALPLELYGYSHKKIADMINPLIELTGLTDKLKHYPSQLSGGQKQRVAIARALASQPKVLLSDEATSALDPETTHMILELLKNIRDKLNLTILLITHEMSVIKECCDKVAILKNGELIEENDIGEFFIHPKTTAAKKFISSSLSKNIIPNAIRDHLLSAEQTDTHPVWHLRFVEKTVTQPVISQLIKQFNLRINIVQANVEYVKQHAMGMMVLAVNGDKNSLQTAMQYLKNIGVEVEVIGHVPNDIISFV